MSLAIASSRVAAHYGYRTINMQEVDYPGAQPARTRVESHTRSGEPHSQRSPVVHLGGAVQSAIDGHDLSNSVLGASRLLHLSSEVYQISLLVYETPRGSTTGRPPAPGSSSTADCSRTVLGGKEKGFLGEA